MMIKSNGGSGTLQNVVFEEFLSHGTAYGIDVDQNWSGQKRAAGDGVQLQNITFLVRPSTPPSVHMPHSPQSFVELGRQRRRRRETPAHPVPVLGRGAVLQHPPHERVHVVADGQGGHEVRLRVRRRRMLEPRAEPHELRGAHDELHAPRAVHDPRDARGRLEERVRDEFADTDAVSIRFRVCAWGGLLGGR